MSTSYAPAFIFLGCLGVAILILLLVCWIAHKYRNGDFIKVSDEETEDEEMELPKEIEIIEKSNNEEMNSEAPTIKFKRLSSTLRPKINFTLEYNKEKRTIKGCIVRLDGLRLIGNCPDMVRFQIKLVPIKQNYKTKTKWIDAYTTVPIQSKFFLGPLKDINDPKSILCIRLYGRRMKCTYRNVCLGEAILLLEKVTSYIGVQGFNASLYPKSSSLVYTSGAIIFTSESESDDDH